MDTEGEVDQLGGWADVFPVLGIERTAHEHRLRSAGKPTQRSVSAERRTPDRTDSCVRTAAARPTLQGESTPVKTQLK